MNNAFINHQCQWLTWVLPSNAHCDNFTSALLCGFLLCLDTNLGWCNALYLEKLPTNFYRYWLNFGNMTNQTVVFTAIILPNEWRVASLKRITTCHSDGGKWKFCHQGFDVVKILFFKGGKDFHFMPMSPPPPYYLAKSPPSNYRLFQPTKSCLQTRQTSFCVGQGWLRTPLFYHLVLQACKIWQYR